MQHIRCKDHYLKTAILNDHGIFVTVIQHETTRQAVSMKAQISLASHPMDGGPLPDEMVAEATKLFLVNGALSIKNVFPRELIQSLHTEFKEKYENLAREEIEKTCLNVGINRFMFTVKLSPPFNDPGLYASERLLPIVKSLLGNDCVIQSFGAVCAFPGATMQHHHKDHPALFIEAGGLNAFLPPYALHVVIPMIDLDEDCGTTALWEGSHRSRAKPKKLFPGEIFDPGLDGASMPYLKVGDCYLMDFRLSHRGTPNKSNRARTILYIVFSRSWFQDHKNFSKQSRLDIDPAEYEKIPEEHRDLFINARSIR